MLRRQFLQGVACGAAAASVSAASAARVVGANDRVNMGLIGCGGRGKLLANLLTSLPDVAITSVCDVYGRRADAAKQWCGGDCQVHRDFRRVLDQKNVDAVVIATPDHWHAIPAVLACQAGKDVYVEKPLAHNIREGQAIVRAARDNDRIVQVGTQHRSAAHYAQAAQIVQSGELGAVRFVRIWNYINMYPQGIGRADDSAPPDDVDWDFYLGPAPEVPFNKNRFVGTYRWFWDYGGGLATDFGTHRFDSMHQIMNVAAPKSVTASGGRFELEDGGDTPDILQATYEYPAFVLSYEASTLNGHGVGGRTPGKKYYRARGRDDRPHGMAIYGTSGTLFVDRIGLELYPEFEPAEDEEDATLRPRAKRRERAAEDATDLHLKNFIECVRSRERPVADAEIGHQASNVAHLANIAYRTGRKLRWDADREEIVDDPEAAKLMGREARQPWDLIRV